MKKSVMLFVNILVFCLTQTVFAQAQEYKVGDKMPDFREGTEFFDQIFGRIGPGQDCDIAIQRYLKNDRQKYQVAFPAQNFGVLPFGIFDAEKGIVFIDNKDANGKNEPDGLIDEIINSSEERGSEDHPYCNK